MTFLSRTGTFLLLMSQVVSAQPSIALFWDVAEDHPYRASIEALAHRGVISGYGDGTYRPEHVINRAEFTKIIVGATFGEEAAQTCIQTRRIPFPDVRADEWFAPMLCLAVQHGIIEGYRDGTFRPELPISLAEAAKILAKTLRVTLPPTEPFDAWFTPSIKALAQEKALPLSLLSPEQLITRGEMAEMLERLQGTGTKPSRTAGEILGPWLLFSDPSLDITFEYPKLTPLLSREESISRSAFPAGDVAWRITLSTADACATGMEACDNVYWIVEEIERERAGNLADVLREEGKTEILSTTERSGQRVIEFIEYGHCTTRSGVVEAGGRLVKVTWTCGADQGDLLSTQVFRYLLQSVRIGSPAQPPAPTSLPPSSAQPASAPTIPKTFFALSELKAGQRIGAFSVKTAPDPASPFGPIAFEGQATLTARYADFRSDATAPMQAICLTDLDGTSKTLLPLLYFASESEVASGMPRVSVRQGKDGDEFPMICLTLPQAVLSEIPVGSKGDMMLTVDGLTLAPLGGQMGAAVKTVLSLDPD